MKLIYLIHTLGCHHAHVTVFAAATPRTTLLLPGAEAKVSSLLRCSSNGPCCSVKCMLCYTTHWQNSTRMKTLRSCSLLAQVKPTCSVSKRAHIHVTSHRSWLRYTPPPAGHSASQRRLCAYRLPATRSRHPPPSFFFAATGGGGGSAGESSSEDSAAADRRLPPPPPPPPPPLSS
jgi:hypothetical protein